MHLLSVLLGVLGNVTAMMVQLSPVPTFWRMYKKRSTGSFSAQPYVWGLTAALMWSFYGILQEETPLITINAACILFQVAYIVIYLRFATGPQRIRTCCSLFIAIAAVVTLVLLTGRHLPFQSPAPAARARPFIPPKQNPAIHTVGLLCTITGILSCASPLLIMHKVIRTASVEYMPFALSLCLFLNGITWLAYALSLRDLFQMIPNAIGTGLATAQLALYTFYKIHGMHASLPSTKIVDQTSWSPNTTKTIESTCQVAINEVV